MKEREKEKEKVSKRNGVEKGEIQCERRKMSIVVSLVLSGCLVHHQQSI